MSNHIFHELLQSREQKKVQTSEGPQHQEQVDGVWSIRCLFGAFDCILCKLSTVMESLQRKLLWKDEAANYIGSDSSCIANQLHHKQFDKHWFVCE